MQRAKHKVVVFTIFLILESALADRQSLNYYSFVQMLSRVIHII